MVGGSAELHDILLAFYCSLCASEQMQSTLQYVSSHSVVTVPSGIVVLLCSYNRH